MRNATIALAAAATFAILSQADTASASAMCSSSSPANDSGDVTFGCVRGQRGVWVATVKELQAWEADGQEYWYTHYQTDTLENLDELCAQDYPNQAVHGACYAEVLRMSGERTWEEFGSPVENECSDGSCSLKVVGVECDCIGD